MHHCYNLLYIFRFESPTRSLQIHSGQDIFIKSGAGKLDANCLNDIRLHSEAGSVSNYVLKSYYNLACKLYTHKENSKKKTTKPYRFDYIRQAYLCQT